MLFIPTFFKDEIYVRVRWKSTQVSDDAFFKEMNKTNSKWDIFNFYELTYANCGFENCIDWAGKVIFYDITRKWVKLDKKYRIVFLFCIDIRNI